MAERRMLTKKVTDDDNFMSLSSSAQALYLHLSMAADDDGFCNQVSISMFKAHASVQDLQALLEKRYIYQFENGVIVIKHWRMANALRKDRYTPTAFQEELKQLKLKDNGSYSWLPNGCQMVANCLPQDRIDKNSIDKNSIYKSNSKELDMSLFQSDETPKTAYQDIVDEWNKLNSYGVRKIRSINSGSSRAKLLKARIDQYGKDAIFEAIEKVKQSDFLLGRTGRIGQYKNWQFDFDWFVKPNNFQNVIEGKYDNENASSATKTNRYPSLETDLQRMAEWGREE